MIQDDIATLNRRWKAGELSHESVVEQALQEAQRDAAAHVFLRVHGPAALEAARHADALGRLGVAQHALAGWPVSIKDLYDEAGQVTGAAARLREGATAASVDAPAVARLRASGAALLGRTNMTEFALSGVGLNPHYGTPVNPADREVVRIPGGSSSGAAVSVALGLCVAGLGSDTGGSIRIPAALCGITGFKSTQSRVPIDGAWPLSRSLDTVCAMARSVHDCLLVDGVLSGQALPRQAKTPSALRLALPRTLVLDALDATVAAAFERALSRLSAAGVAIVEVPLEQFAEIAQINKPGGLVPIEAWTVYRELLATQRDRFDPRVAARMSLGQDISAADYVRLLDRRADWIGRTRQALTDFDAYICPTVPMVVPPVSEVSVSDEAFFAANARLLRNTFTTNFLDGCAFSLPCHREGELPVGLMLAAPGGEDARLAGVALSVESVLSGRS